jgi:3'-5' exoribonuclease
MLNQKGLNEYSPGEEITLFLIVNKYEVKTAKNGKAYINLELRDKSLVIPAKIWDNVEKYSDKLKAGAVVKAAGQIEEYLGSPQMRIDKLRLAELSDNVKSEDFLPHSNRPLNVMINELNEIINSVSNPYLNKLIKIILSTDNLEKYIKAPAGKGWHHAYIHGLLEHTLEIIKICDLMYSFHPVINRDLLICGALLHDFGKTEELTFDSVFDYSDKGKLIGHIMISAFEIEKTASSIPDFPKELKNQLIHIVLSHQGKLEFASPVEPKTLEAIVLYQADELSAKSNAYKYAIAADKNKEGNWTRFLPLVNTSLYTKRDFPE